MSARPRRALITGITGQDGSLLAEQLLDGGDEVIGVTRRDPGDDLGPAEILRERITLLCGEVLEPATLAAVRDLAPDEIYHLAAPTFVPDSWLDPGATMTAIHGSTAALLGLLADGLPFYGYDAQDAYWCDIGTPGEYRRATADVLNGGFHIPETRANGADPTASIAASASIDPNVWIGAHARIGEGVRIAGPSVIGDRTVVEDGAVLDASIVWEDSTIGAGAHLRDAVVGQKTRIESRSQLDGEVVASSQAA